MNKHWLRAVFRRRVIIILLILLQVAFILYVVTSGSNEFRLVSRILTVLSVHVALYVAAKKDKGAYKTTWVFLILSFPLFGGLMYLLFHLQTSKRRFAKGVLHAKKKTERLYTLPGDAFTQAEQKLGSWFPQVRYLQNYAGFPVYSDTAVKYLSPGETFFDVLLPELEKAEKYIFLEFFIVQEGVMWNSILEILKRKAAQGVCVRLIYDDLGCFLTLPNHYAKKLKSYGIDCVVFNPFRPVMTVKQNNRDHRKIISIDGKVAFTSGINLADEYINAYEKHGHWKDAGIMLEGRAAWSFTLMFLENWLLCTGANEDFSRYFPSGGYVDDISADGFVQPYADSPTDAENVGEHVYLQILSQAQDYVYINTPYLIVDDSMLSALCLAAKRGVDVRIVTPHKWDKRLIHITTRSYYRDLIQAGVKVYEYSKGFMHSKTFVADDYTATVGTTNLDFRSLYLHFECGTLLFGSKAVMEIKSDFLRTLDSCQLITEEDCRSNFLMQMVQEILRLFAPLM